MLRFEHVWGLLKKVMVGDGRWIECKFTRTLSEKSWTMFGTFHWYRAFWGLGTQGAVTSYVIVLCLLSTFGLSAVHMYTGGRQICRASMNITLQWKHNVTA